MYRFCTRPNLQSELRFSPQATTGHHPPQEPQLSMSLNGRALLMPEGRVTHILPLAVFQQGPCKCSEACRWREALRACGILLILLVEKWWNPWSLPCDLTAEVLGLQENNRKWTSIICTDSHTIVKCMWTQTWSLTMNPELNSDWIRQITPEPKRQPEDMCILGEMQ